MAPNINPNSAKLQDPEQPHLFIHEWLIVTVLIALVLGLAILSLIGKEKNVPSTETFHHILPPEIEVYIEGAVEKPGRYSAKRGESIEELLSKLKTLPEADLRKIKWKSKLRNGQIIKIPKKNQKKQKSSPKSSKPSEA